MKQKVWHKPMNLHSQPVFFLTASQRFYDWSYPGGRIPHSTDCPASKTKKTAVDLVYSGQEQYGFPSPTFNSLRPLQTTLHQSSPNLTHGVRPQTHAHNGGDSRKNTNQSIQRVTATKHVQNTGKIAKCAHPPALTSGGQEFNRGWSVHR